LFTPRGIAFLGGNLLVASTFDNTISEFTPSGVPINLSFISEGLSGPEDIVVVPQGVPDSAPGPVVFGAVVLAIHFLRRRIVV
jgi:hypothetical protein